MSPAKSTDSLIANIVGDGENGKAGRPSSLDDCFSVAPDPGQGCAIA